MRKPLGKQTGKIQETISGIVERVTFHNPENGWTILRVFPFNNPHQQETVIIPVLTQHFKMLFRNLIYTGLTRARKFAFFVGTRRALAMAVKNQDTSQRQTALKGLIMAGTG